MKYLPIFLLAISATLFAQKSEDLLTESTFKGLELRNIGPAFTSGRIADIAVDPYTNWRVEIRETSAWRVARGASLIYSGEQ